MLLLAPVGLFELSAQRKRPRLFLTAPPGAAGCLLAAANAAYRWNHRSFPELSSCGCVPAAPTTGGLNALDQHFPRGPRLGGSSRASRLRRCRQRRRYNASGRRHRSTACSRARGWWHHNPAACDSAAIAPRAHCKSARLVEGSVAFGEPVETDEPLQQPFHGLQRQHIRPVGRRVVGVLVRLDEDSRHADRDGRAGQHRHEAPIAT